MCNHLHHNGDTIQISTLEYYNQRSDEDQLRFLYHLFFTNMSSYILIQRYQDTMDLWHPRWDMEGKIMVSKHVSNGVLTSLCDLISDLGASLFYHIMSKTDLWLKVWCQDIRNICIDHNYKCILLVYLTCNLYAFYW